MYIYTYMYIYIHTYIYIYIGGNKDEFERLAIRVYIKVCPPLYPAPCTLHPAPFTLHPAPYTMHPAPCTHQPRDHSTHFSAEEPARLRAWLPQAHHLKIIATDWSFDASRLELSDAKSVRLEYEPASEPRDRYLIISLVLIPHNLPRQAYHENRTCPLRVSRLLWGWLWGK